MSEPTAAAPRPAVTAMRLGSGPRFARDAVAPPLVFSLVFKALGLTFAILAATLVSTAIWWWERPGARTGIGASVGFAETYPFPAAVKASATYRRVFSRVSIAWGTYLLARSAVRLLTPAQG